MAAATNTSVTRPPRQYTEADRLADIAWLIERGFTFWRCDLDGDNSTGRLRLIPAPPEEADLVSSDTGEYVQMPVLDIDWNAEPAVAKILAYYDIRGEYRLVPSSTRGHWHLFVAERMVRRYYMRLLDRLRQDDVISDGYYRLCAILNQSVVRVPGQFKKPEADSFYERKPWPRPATP
jgi:hypothetical protein